MTREEAIIELKKHISLANTDANEALDIAIKVLESKSCDKCAYYDNGVNDEPCAGCFEDYKYPNFKSKEGMTGHWVKYSIPRYGPESEGG